jgi:hypothetical protein
LQVFGWCGNLMAVGPIKSKAKHHEQRDSNGSQ